MAVFNVIMLLAIFPAISYSQNYYTFRQEGERCFLPDGSVGICRVRSSCQREWGFQTSMSDRLMKQPCGFTDSDEKLFCCRPTFQKAQKACETYTKWARNNPRKSNLIFNGRNAAHGDFPHMVALWSNVSLDNTRTQWKCSGSLISERFALTAAHCLRESSKTPPSKLRVGDLDLNDESDDYMYTVTYDIQQIIIHPYYNTRRSKYFDIGLVKTSLPVDISGPSVRPACLHFTQDVPISSFYVSGYGRNESIGGTIGVLQCAELHIIDSATCNVSYLFRENDVPRGIINSQICAQSDPDADGKYSDTCEGDSGGPLQYEALDVFCIIGITSFGPRCGGQGSYKPGVYTRVSEFAAWIETFVWRE